MRSIYLPSSRTAQRGISLVEIMIALVVGSIVMAAMSLLYANTSTSRTELEKIARLTENARYGSEVVSEGLKLAGFYGFFAPDESGVYVTSNPCSKDINDWGFNMAASPRAFASPLQVIENAGTTLGDAGCDISAHSPRDGTMALLVRHADTSGPVAIADMIADTIYSQASRCPSDASTLVISANSADMTLQNQDCSAALDSVHRIRERIYFISDCNNCVAADGIPTLKRAELVEGEWVVTGIAEGVENLQFELGLDTDSDGSPNAYVTPADIDGTGSNLWSNVVSGRFFMLTRAIDPTPNYTNPRTFTLGTLAGAAEVTPADNFRRIMNSSTVRMTNAAMRLESDT